MDDDDAAILAGYEELIGRVSRKRGRRSAMPGAMAIAKRRETKLARMAHDLPSADGRVMRQFLGMPIATFVNAGATSLPVQTLPLRSFQIDKVIIDVGRTGAGAAGQIVQITRFKIGSEDMLASNDPIGIGMFNANATYSLFKGYTAKAGIPVFITYQIVGAALGVGETISVQFEAYGDAVAG